jgi:hypothetical protein
MIEQDAYLDLNGLSKYASLKVRTLRDYLAGCTAFTRKGIWVDDVQVGFMIGHTGGERNGRSESE